jgi:hypothetical protein
MVDQASVRGSTTAHSPRHGSAAGAEGGIAEFIHDVVTLAELQTDLAALNFKETARKAAVPIGLIVLSLTLMAAGATVALIGSGLLLASALKIHQGWAMIATAGVVMALTGPAAMFGVARLRSSFDSFRPSREELRRNLTWLRAVIISRGRSSPRRVK